MATVTEMRAWLRDHGEQVPDRGRLRPDLIALYENAHPDAGDLPDDWPDDELLAEAIGADEPAEVAPEVRPSRKRTRTQPSSRGADRLIGRVLFGEKKQDTKKGTKKPPPRVSLEKFTGRIYSMTSRVLAPLSPAAARCCEVQGPMAGVLLEDIIKGTVVDRVLQPVARAEEKLDTLFALGAPPIACMTIELTEAQIIQNGWTPQLGLRRTVAVQMLREGLRTGLELSEKFAEQIAEARERAARSDAEVDRLIGMIFPQMQATAEDVPQAEQEMAGAAA